MLNIKSKFVLELPPGADLNYVVGQLAEWDDELVVNIADSSNSETMLFTVENLQSLLLRGIEKLYIETVAEKEYWLLMQTLLTQLGQKAGQLQDQLRYQYVMDILTFIADFLSQIQNITMLLTSSALQKGCSSLMKELDTLRQLQGQLGESAFYYEDNVRCLDDVRLGILPCLKQIQFMQRTI